MTAIPTIDITIHQPNFTPVSYNLMSCLFKTFYKSLNLLPFIFFHRHCGHGVASGIYDANILGSNPMTDCMKFVSGIKCCVVQKAIANC